MGFLGTRRAQGPQTELGTRVVAPPLRACWFRTLIKDVAQTGPAA
jgi:hypothetical protein